MRMHQAPSFRVAEPTLPYLRMKLVDRVLRVADADAYDEDVGTLEDRTVLPGEAKAIVPRNVEGTIKVVVDGPVEAGDNLYPANGGRFSKNQLEGTYRRAIAMDSASRNGDAIEVMPIACPPVEQPAAPTN